MRYTRLSLSLLLILLILGGGSRLAGAKMPVTASILPLGDFCGKIGGPWVEVRVLIPPGASPHVFEPSPTAVARAAEAKVFVYVGAGLDPWAERLLRSRAARNLVSVAAVEGIPLIQEVAPHHPQPKASSSSGRHAHHHEGGNPHVWLDPVLAQDICRRIARAFSQADPAHQAEYEARLAAYLEELQRLHADIAAQVAEFRIREYVTFHPAFAYFSRRYGLKEVGVIEEAPGREPSPGHIRRIVSAIRSYGIKAVFAEPQLNPRVAEVIAKEAGVKVLLLDPLGGRPPYGNDYIQMMRHNLQILSQALK